MRKGQEQVERNAKRGLIILLARDRHGRAAQEKSHLGSDSIKIVEPADGEAFTVFHQRCRSTGVEELLQGPFFARSDSSREVHLRRLELDQHRRLSRPICV
jgi:hypothetical protein